MTYVETNKQITLQEMNEERFDRKGIDTRIREFIDTSELMQEKIAQGVELLQGYISGEYYESKMNRIAQLKDLDLTQLVKECFVGILYYQREQLFTGITAQLASRLGFNDKAEGITTMAEIIAVLGNTDVFDTYKMSAQASLMLVSNIELPEGLIHFASNTEYLPPMVCEPLELTSNRSSGHLTFNDSLVLGAGNHHNGDLCLDVLNKMNQVALSLDTQFLSTVEEEMPEVSVESMMDKAEEKGKTLSQGQAMIRVKDFIDNWDDFKQQSYYFYSLMESQGNRFHLTHKVDKRGRMYSQGYHITTQGTPFKKASLEFANEELVNGVPDEYRL